MRCSSLFSVLILLGCGSESPSPDTRVKADLFPWVTDQRAPNTCQATCSGCCSGTACMPGNATNACGTSGKTCTTCKSTDQCSNGICVVPQCGTSNCKDGCCDKGGSCKSGTTETACGTGGAACATCDSATESCLQYKCSPKGSGEYKVVLMSAVVTYDCGYLDGGCDPYVILTVGSTKATSAAISDNNSPSWNKEALLTAKGSDIISGFNVEVWDSEVTMDSQIATCAPKVTDADLAAGKLVAACGTTVKDLTFTFEAQ